MSLLLFAGIGYNLLAILFVFVCLCLVFMVVITPSSEGGMAAAFGGMGSDSFFGTKAHQSINKVTLVLAVTFLVLAILLNTIKAGSISSAAAPGVVAPGVPSETEKGVRDRLPAPPPQNPSGLPQGLPPLPPPPK